jgi:uncharacterized membrane protein YgcG
MASNQRFECPACGFLIYNRRVSKCEACSAELPKELLLTPRQIAELDAAHEKSRKEREARAQRDKSQETTWGGEGSWSGSDGGSGGDGGGGGD